MHYRRRRASAGLRLLVAGIASLALATPVVGGEISDENDAVEKIVIRVNDDPERDPELSVGGETIRIHEGDEVTFRIAINEDQTLEGRDDVAIVKDVYKANRFEFVSVVGEFGAECTPETPEADDMSVTCEVNLDPEDGNAALRIRLRALDVEGEGCVVATNVVSTVEPSGGDQAQVEICPAEEPATGTIVVTKAVTGRGFAAGELFGFSLGSSAFQLGIDGSSSFELPPGPYVVSEVLTAAQQSAGWTFVSAVCDDATGPPNPNTSGSAAAVSLDAGQAITCVFTNNFAAAQAAVPTPSPTPAALLPDTAAEPMLRGAAVPLTFAAIAGLMTLLALLIVAPMRARNR